MLITANFGVLGLICFLGTGGVGRCFIYGDLVVFQDPKIFTT